MKIREENYFTRRNIGCTYQMLYAYPQFHNMFLSVVFIETFRFVRQNKLASILFIANDKWRRVFLYYMKQSTIYIFAFCKDLLHNFLKLKVDSWTIRSLISDSCTNFAHSVHVFLIRSSLISKLSFEVLYFGHFLQNTRLINSHIYKSTKIHFIQGLLGANEVIFIFVTYLLLFTACFYTQTNETHFYINVDVMCSILISSLH